MSAVVPIDDARRAEASAFAKATADRSAFAGATADRSASACTASDHTRASLSAGLARELAPLRRLDPLRRTGEIALFAALWGFGIWLGLRSLDAVGWFSWLLGIASVAASAAALNAFYLLSHEGHHGLLFANRTLNHLVNVALCVPLLHAPSAYVVLHTLHHRHLGGPGDPDEYRNYTDSARLRWVLQWVRLTMGTLVYMPLIPVVAWRRATGRERVHIAVEYAAMSVAWIAVFTRWPIGVLLQVWLVPGVLVGYISAVRALAQHALTDRHDPLLASRSVQSNPLVSFLLLNENYHLEHHLFPEIPSYRLPALRALLHTRLPQRVEARSYSRFLAGFVARTVRGDESVLGLTPTRASTSEVRV